MGWGKVFFHPRRASRELERMESELTELSRQLAEATDGTMRARKDLEAAHGEIRLLKDANRLLEDDLNTTRDSLREQTELEKELVSVMEKLEQTADMRSRYEKRIEVLRRRLSEEMARKDGVQGSPGEIDMLDGDDLTEDKQNETAASAASPAKTLQQPRQLNLFNEAVKTENERKEDPIDLLSPLPEDFLEA